MRKIITIAQSVLDTEYRHGQPVRSFVGGRIPCAAASLAQCGIATYMVSECTQDAVGDIIVDYLNSHQVDTTSIDRYPDGATPFSAIFKDESGTQSIVNYGQYPDDRFKVIWPRIDKDDILIFGSLYSVDLPQRERLYELVSYAVERKAIIVYLPGFQHGINFRITRVMPNILENLEASSIVIAQQQDIDTIFPGETAAEVWNNHIEFYCDTYLHITPSLNVERYGKHPFVHSTEAGIVDNTLGWQAGFTAGVVYALITAGITHDSLPEMDAAAWKAVVDEATQWAQASLNPDNCITPQWAHGRQEAMARALQQHENNRITK